MGLYMLIFEANLEQRPAAVFRLNPFSCFPIISQLFSKEWQKVTPYVDCGMFLLKQKEWLVLSEKVTPFYRFLCRVNKSLLGSGGCKCYKVKRARTQRTPSYFTNKMPILNLYRPCEGRTSRTDADLSFVTASVRRVKARPTNDFNTSSRRN